MVVNRSQLAHQISAFGAFSRSEFQDTPCVPNAYIDESHFLPRIAPECLLSISEVSVLRAFLVLPSLLDKSGSAPVIACAPIRKLAR